MVLVNRKHINEQIFTATLLPKRGDREDFDLRVQGPDPNTDFHVPLSVTGTALAIWGNPPPIDAAEALGEAIFHVSGTASQPPPEGYWFDSYNSGENLKQTIDKIYNLGATPFVKNAPSALFVNSLGKDINEKIQKLDEIYSVKFGGSFFKSLEDISEESQRVDDLNTPPIDNANYLYRVCILSGIIDHMNVHLEPEDEHVCSECHQRHKQPEGTLQALKRWLAEKISSQDAEKLTTTFQMIKKLRNQYPIHDHYTVAREVIIVRKQIADANAYFGIRKGEYEDNTSKVMKKFSESLDEVIDVIQKISTS